MKIYEPGVLWLETGRIYLSVTYHGGTRGCVLRYDFYANVVFIAHADLCQYNNEIELV